MGVVATVKEWFVRVELSADEREYLDVADRNLDTIKYSTAALEGVLANAERTLPDVHSIKQVEAIGFDVTDATILLVGCQITLDSIYDTSEHRWIAVPKSLKDFHWYLMSALAEVEGAREALLVWAESGGVSYGSWAQADSQLKATQMHLRKALVNRTPK